MVNGDKRCGRALGEAGTKVGWRKSDAPTEKVRFGDGFQLKMDEIWSDGSRKRLVTILQR
jgi:hypothetical protein